MSVDEVSQKYLSINTHKGLYAYMKLPYPVKVCAKNFSSNLDKIKFCKVLRSVYAIKMISFSVALT